MSATRGSNGDNSLVASSNGNGAHAAAVVDPIFGSALAAPAAPTNVAEPQRQHIVQQLWRHKWLAISLFLIIAVPTVLGVALFYVPMYEAQAVVQVSPTIPRIVYRTDDNGTIPLYQQYLNSQVAVIRGPVVLQRVLDRTEVQQTVWYREQPAIAIGNAPTQLERLTESLSVQPRPRTSLVDVRLESRKAKDAALIVNAVVEEYLQYVQDRSNETDNQVYAAVTQEYNSLSRRISALKPNIAQLRDEVGHWTPEELLSQQRARLDQKQAELTAIQDRMRLAEWQRERLAGASQATSQPETADADTDAPHEIPFELDQDWRRLNRELEQARDALALEQHLGEKNPRRVQLTQAVTLAEEALARHEKRLEALWDRMPPEALAQVAAADGKQLSVVDLDARIEQLRFEESLKTADVDRERKQVEQTSQVASRLSEQLDELGELESRFQDVRERRFTMDMERRAPASIEVLASAYPASQPHNDKRRLMLVALGLFAGMLTGLGAAYVRASTSRTVHNVDDVAETTRMPFLGRVPIVRNDNPRDLAIQSEHVRMIRTALLRRLEDGMGNVLQITSAGPGAGKTTFSLLLADSLARCGKRVLLVDADLRHPSVHERYKIGGEPGLVCVLRDRAGDDTAVVHREDIPLSVLPVGRVMNTSDGELLSNGVFSRALQRWRREYDLVVFDSSPVLPVADSRILARHVDGTVVMVREKHCHRAEVRDALADLHRAGANFLGIVFVGGVNGASYRRGYYNDYYAAHTPATDLSVRADEQS